MAKYGTVTDEMYAGRGSSHGQITDLTGGFQLGNNNPVSLFIIPRSDGADPDALVALVDCKLYQDDDASPCPFTVNCWDTPFVRSIEPGGIDLANFDVYWAGGTYIDQGEE